MTLDRRCAAECEDRRCSEYISHDAETHEGPHHDGALFWSSTHFYWRSEPDKTHERRCDYCSWPLKATTQEGCTASSCSKRPRPKKREAWSVYGGTHLPRIARPGEMPEQLLRSVPPQGDLAQLLIVSTRIREYEAAADTLTALARLASDVQVRATLQQQALELVQTAGQWRVRQDAELAKVPQHGPPGGSYAKHIKAEVDGASAFVGAAAEARVQVHNPTAAPIQGSVGWPVDPSKVAKLGLEIVPYDHPPVKP